LRIGVVIGGWPGSYFGGGRQDFAAEECVSLIDRECLLVKLDRPMTSVAFRAIGLVYRCSPRNAGRKPGGSAKALAPLLG
jgi:hypothetical protein